MALERCDWHTPSFLDFLSAFSDAEERMAQGERQRQCPICYLWYWKHEWGIEPAGLNLPVIRYDPDKDEIYDEKDRDGNRPGTECTSKKKGRSKRGGQ